jgi:imidazolonepropionase-like amidohydrolase
VRYRFYSRDHGHIQIFQRHARGHRRSFEVGVSLVFGSDVITNVPGHTRGSAILSLIDTWIEAEIPPLEILMAMPINGALLLGIEKERGAIKPGMLADIIATPENPIDDIQALKKVKFVLKEGKVFRHIQ